MGGRTEWKIDVILPETSDMTIVADTSLPEITAREDARTVIRSSRVVMVKVPWGGSGQGSCVCILRWSRCHERRDEPENKNRPCSII